MRRGGEVVAVPERVETVARAGDRRIHRFQVVRERLDDESTREWVVVDVGEDAVRLASLDFEWTTTAALDAFETFVVERTREP